MPSHLSITTIPPEILGHIFLFLVPGRTLTIPSRDVDTLFRVTHTCSSWRAIALRHPYLWNDLNIQLRGWSDQSTMHAVSVCLGHGTTHSPSTPLSIRLHIKKYLNYWTSPAGIHAPTFLIPHAHRIERLSILSPMSLTPLVLPHLIDLEVLAPGWEAHPDMHIPALLQRSGSSLTRLSVGFVNDWLVLLEQTPHLEALVVGETIPEEAMRQIATGRLGARIREMECAVAIHDSDVFLEMLEARAAEKVYLGPGVGVSPITRVEARCADFSLDVRQWARIHTLMPEMHVDISDG